METGSSNEVDNLVVRHAFDIMIVDALNPVTDVQVVIFVVFVAVAGVVVAVVVAGVVVVAVVEAVVVVVVGCRRVGLNASCWEVIESKFGLFYQNLNYLKKLY